MFGGGAFQTAAATAILTASILVLSPYQTIQSLKNRNLLLIRANPKNKQEKRRLKEEIKPVPAEIAKLKETADKNVAQIMSLNMESLGERKEILQSIESFGLQTLKTTSQKNSLLQVTVGNLSKTGDEGGQVAKDLGELQLTLKDFRSRCYRLC